MKYLKIKSKLNGFFCVKKSLDGLDTRTPIRTRICLQIHGTLKEVLTDCPPVRSFTVKIEESELNGFFV